MLEANFLLKVEGSKSFLSLETALKLSSYAAEHFWMKAAENALVLTLYKLCAVRVRMCSTSEDVQYE